MELRRFNVLELIKGRININQELKDSYRKRNWKIRALHEIKNKLN